MLIESLHGVSQWTRSPMTNGNIRMSMTENCPRQQVYVALGFEQDYPETGRSQMAADDGNLHEADVVNRFLQAGYRCWNYGEDQAMVHFQRDGVRFRGHPDLFMETPEGEVVGVELKGYRDETFRQFVQGATQTVPGMWSVSDWSKLTKRPYPLMGQLQMYLHSDTSASYGIDKWILVMKNKNTAELAECIITKDDDYINRLIRKWKGFWAYIEAGRLPERFFGDDSIECRRCLFREKCWNLGEVFTSKEDVVHVKGLEKFASMRREGSLLKKDAEGLLEEARMAFLTEHINKEANRIECDGLTSTVSERNRRGLDSTEVNKVLAHMLEKGNIDDQQYDDCFNDSTYQEVRFKDVKPRDA